MALITIIDHNGNKYTYFYLWKKTFQSGLTLIHITSVFVTMGCTVFTKAFCMHVHFCNVNIHINTHTRPAHDKMRERVPHSLLPRFIKNHPNRLILLSIWFCSFLFISCDQKRAELRFYVQIFPTLLRKRLSFADGQREIT